MFFHTLRSVQICSVFCYPSDLAVLSGSVQSLALAALTVELNTVSVLLILTWWIYLRIIIIFTVLYNNF